MKRLLISAAVAAALPAAHAQSITAYGLLDVAVEHLTNVGANGDSVTRVPGLSGTFPSRIGFRGTQDIGNGLRAIATLEQGFGLDSGTANQGGRLFGRQAFVGLAGDWGTVTLGRQYTMLFWSMLDADILGANTFGSSSLDSYLPNARADNALAYKGTFSGFTGGFTYSAGRDAVNAGPSPSGTNCAGENPADGSACREWSVLAKYDAANWGASFVVDEMRGGPGAFGGLTNSGLKDRRTGVNGYAKFGDLKIGAGLLRRDNEGSAATPKSDLWYLGATYAVTPLITVDGELFRLGYKDSGNQATLFALRGSYSLFKQTAVYATLGYVSNEGALAASVSSGATGGAPVAGNSQKGLAVGMRYAF